MYVPIGKGQSILSAEGRAWKKLAELEFLNQRGIGSEPFYWRADYLIPGAGANIDLSNYEKALTDSLVTAELVPDDRYLVDYRVRFYSGSNVKIAIAKEDLQKWATIKNASKSLIRKLAKHTG